MNKHHGNRHKIKIYYIVLAADDCWSKNIKYKLFISMSSRKILLWQPTCKMDMLSLKHLMFLNNLKNNHSWSCYDFIKFENFRLFVVSVAFLLPVLFSERSKKCVFVTWNICLLLNVSPFTCLFFIHYLMYHHFMVANT